MDEYIEIIVPPDQAIEVITPEETSLELVEEVLYVEILQPPAVYIEMLVDSVVEEIEIVTGFPIYFVAEGAGTMVYNETPVGNIDGANASFVTAHTFQPGGLLVYLNGLRQRITQDYGELTTQTFIFTDAPLVGDSVRVDYLRL